MNAALEWLLHTTHLWKYSGCLLFRVPQYTNIIEILEYIIPIPSYTYHIYHYDKLWNYYPLVNSQFAIENGPVEIVDVPIKHGDFP